MTSQDAVVVGSVEVGHIDANSVPSAIVPISSACTVRAAHTDPHSVSSRDLLDHHPTPKQLKRDSTTTIISPRGAASACTTTPVTKKWIGPLENFAAGVDKGETSTSSEPTSGMKSETNSHTVKKTKKRIPASTVTARVEVEPTSIQKGG